jgi:hypothetical protein
MTSFISWLRTQREHADPRIASLACLIGDLDVRQVDDAHSLKLRLVDLCASGDEIAAIDAAAIIWKDLKNDPLI